MPRYFAAWPFKVNNLLLKVFATKISDNPLFPFQYIHTAPFRTCNLPTKNGSLAIPVCGNYVSLMTHYFNPLKTGYSPKNQAVIPPPGISYSLFTSSYAFLLIQFKSTNASSKREMKVSWPLRIQARGS